MKFSHPVLNPGWPDIMLDEWRAIGAMGTMEFSLVQRRNTWFSQVDAGFGHVSTVRSDG